MPEKIVNHPNGLRLKHISTGKEYRFNENVESVKYDSDKFIVLSQEQPNLFNFFL